MNKIQMTPCDSSQIHAYGYDADTSTLALQFKSSGKAGAVYHYADVPQEVYDEFLAASSKGRFLRDRIKTGGYQFKRQ